MKIHLITLLILFLIMGTTSCRKLRTVITYENDYQDTPVGEWEDIIQFSSTELIINSEHNIRTITSKGDWWWISSYIQINDETVLLTEEEHKIVSTKGEVEKGPFGINTENIIFDKGANSEIKTIKGEWFSIKKDSATKLSIELKNNKTGKERTLIIPIQCGNYFTQISIKQKP